MIDEYAEGSGMKSKSLTNKVYETSGKIFEQVSIKANPAMYEQLRAVKGGEIVVVKGTYDHIEKLLDTIKVPYDLISMDQVKTYNGGRVMFVNCAPWGADYDGEGEGKIPKKTIETFVSEGGRLITTDWSLSVITTTFPKKLKKIKDISDDVVEIQCHTDLVRRFVGLNYAQCHPKWWLEGSSHLYDILDGVTPIITSDEMEEKYGKPYVVVGFTHDRGEVFHFISHLELQRTHLRTKSDEAGLDEFLKKMKAVKTADMDEAKLAELEAAYSTLNTLACLCIRTPILNTSMKSILVGSSKNAMKSKGLA